jgi:hypothetical protein
MSKLLCLCIKNINILNAGVTWPSPQISVLTAPFLLSVWVRSDKHTELSGKGRSDGKNSIIYTVCVISLRKNLNSLSSRDEIGLDQNGG